MSDDAGALATLEAWPEPAYPGPQHDGSHQGNHSAREMDHTRASKVIELTGGDQ